MTADNIIPANIMAALMSSDLSSVPPPLTPQELLQQQTTTPTTLPGGLPMLQPPPINNLVVGSDIPPPPIPGFPIPGVPPINPFAQNFKKPANQVIPNPFQKAAAVTNGNPAPEPLHDDRQSS